MARVILLADVIPLAGVPGNPEGPLTGGFEFPDDLEPFVNVHEVHVTKGTDNDPGHGYATVSVGYYQSSDEVEDAEAAMRTEAPAQVRPVSKIKPPKLTVVHEDGSVDDDDE